MTAPGRVTLLPSVIGPVGEITAPGWPMPMLKDPPRAPFSTWPKAPQLMPVFASSLRLTSRIFASSMTWRSMLTWIAFRYSSTWRSSAPGARTTTTPAGRV